MDTLLADALCERGCSGRALLPFGAELFQAYPCPCGGELRVKRAVKACCGTSYFSECLTTCARRAT